MTDVRGECPACRRTGLFLGEGGFVTCPQSDCPNPGAPSDVLHWAAFPDDPFSPDLHDAFSMLRAVARHCAVLASYEIRPYDPHLDRRRWRWQTSGRARSQAWVRSLDQAVIARLAAAASERARSPR